MIIYPSESFVVEQTLSEKKLNTYFELTAPDDSVADSIFSDDGVQVFVNEEAETQKYVYCVLPLIEYLCFEIFNGGGNTLNLKALITHWKEYVQAVRSHTSLYAESCTWHRFTMQMTTEQCDLYNDLENLILNDELRELDDIIRACCGAEVNKDSKKIPELQIASKLAQSVSALKHKETKLHEYKSSEIEKAALEVKCEKLAADVQTNESIATKNNALLQTKRKEVEQLSEELKAAKHKASIEVANKNEEINILNNNVKQANEHLIALKEEVTMLQHANFKQARDLEALASAKQDSENQLESQLNNQKQELENKLAKTIEGKEGRIHSLEEEAQLMQLQVLQLQEELETLFNDKQELESQLKNQKQELENKLAKTIEGKEGRIHSLEEEAQLMQLQVLQLQEELETLFSNKQELERQLKNQKQELGNKLAKTVEEKDDRIHSLEAEAQLMQSQVLQLQEELANTDNIDTSSLESTRAENELMQLQILQLQEELEFYFEKASAKPQNNSSLPVVNEEKRVDNIANTLLENHNTLSLITRLVVTQERES